VKQTEKLTNRLINELGCYVMFQTNCLQAEDSYTYYSYTPDDEDIQKQPRAASTPPPEIPAIVAIQPARSDSLPVCVAKHKWGAHPPQIKSVVASSSSSSNLPARVTPAVAAQPKQSEPESVLEYNDRDDVGTLSFSNYSELQGCSSYELFNDLRTGPASFIIIQDVTDEFWRRFEVFNSDSYFHDRWVANVAVLAKADRVRHLDLIAAHNIEVNDKIVLTILIVGVRLAVPFCNSSSITVASMFVTKHMHESDLEYACDLLKTWILTHDIRIIGGKFCHPVANFIRVLRGCGVLLNLVAWLPFVSEDGKTLYSHQSHVLIAGPLEDKANIP
jgi:hypothetical protein